MGRQGLPQRIIAGIDVGHDRNGTRPQVQGDRQEQSAHKRETDPASALHER